MPGKPVSNDAIIIKIKKTGSKLTMPIKPRVKSIIAFHQGYFFFTKSNWAVNIMKEVDFL